MIEYIEGDIFESPAQVIVNTVNTVGVMGKGLALAFRKRYPKMFERYKQACDNRSLDIGKLMLFYEADHWVLLFPTKRNWRNPSKLEYIEQGLDKFVKAYADKQISSIAFPRLGCGNGGLDWNDVKPIMERYLKNLPIRVYVYLRDYPELVPEHKEQQKTMGWLKKNAKSMSFLGLKDDLMHTGLIVPYEFVAIGKRYQMLYVDNEMTLTSLLDDKIVKVDEKSLHVMWDELQNDCVVESSGKTGKKPLVYALLESLGYLSKIKLYVQQDDKMVEGYQLNEALGRVKGLQDT